MSNYLFELLRGYLTHYGYWAVAAVLLLEKATPAELAEQIAARGVTVCFTAPTAYRAMIASGQAGLLRGLRRPVSAGEHLPATTWQAFYDATGVKIIDGIGSTELLHIFISSPVDQIRPGATGRVVPGYLAEIHGEDGKPVPDGEAGRLAVKGPTGCRYLADDRQRAYVRDGWNITGDTYRRDADGYFWYQARSDDIIISSGYNIAGPEVEEALLSHPEVAECGVVGVPDEARGQIVKAYVVLADGAVGDPAKAAEIYLRLANDKKNSLETMTRMVSDPDFDYTIVPLKVAMFADFMQRVGRLPAKPASWRDLFFADIHDLPGS